MSLENRKAEYLTHEAEGKDYYNSFRSQLTLDIEAGTKTLEQAIGIHDRLAEVGCCLLTGDWKSAYNKISDTLPTPHCSKEVIDSMKADILNYITTNYSW